MKKSVKFTIFSSIVVLGILVGLLGVQAIFAESTIIEIPDLTTVSEDVSGEGYTWDLDTKTLTLSGVKAKGVTVPANTKIVIAEGTTNVINASDASGIYSEGAVQITGNGKLEITGSNGIKAASVSIEGIDVDFKGTSCGIQVYNGTGAALVTLTNVDGSIEGGYAGIYVNGECTETDAAVVIDGCELDATSTATSWNNRARKSGITVYVSTAEKVDSSITIKNSKVNATGYDAGLSINNYLGDADATNSACATINIENSTVVAHGTSGTWSGIFASVLGQHPDANAIINLTNSSVYATSTSIGIMSSAQKGETKIVMDNSILGVSGKTALNMKGNDGAKVQVAELKNGSTYVQLTPMAAVEGEIIVEDGKTIVATEKEISFDEENNYYVIPQGTVVTEKFTDGTENSYTFNKQAGGVGGFDYDKDEIWGYDVEFKWEDGDIIIYTPEELIEFATYTQDGTLGNCEGRVVKLGADIDMKNYDWYYRNAEGTVVTDHRIPKFAGKFDGQGFTIKNMKYRDEYKEATAATALSFIINCTGILENINLDTITVDTVAPSYFGGLVDEYAWFKSGSTRYVDSCTVKNVVVNSTSDLVFGGMFRKVIDGTKVSNCHVENIEINADGALTGPNSGRCGGFVATGGETTKFENCSVSGLVINAASTGGHIGGFIGGASMTAGFYNCDVNGFELYASEKFSAVGGFMGYTAGSAWGSGMIIENCDVTELNVESNARISAAGGFIGYTYGQGKSLTDGAHNFTNCTAEGSITTGAESKTGGFIGWLYGRGGNGCAANFTNCKAAVNVYSESFGGGFAGYYVPYDTNKMVTSYTDCTSSGDVFAVEPIGSFLGTGIIGGTYNYDPENVDEATGETNNVAEGYRALDNGDGTWTVFADQGREVVKVSFNRLNDETGEYENWRTVEVFKGVDFFESSFDNNLNFSHPAYRFANGIGELDEEADDKTTYKFLFWTDTPYGTTLVLDNEIEVEGDMIVYANYEFEDITDDPIPGNPPETGDGTVILALVSLVALALGFVVIGKKRLA